ncbi:MAG: hypothetical protein RL145_1384 [Pseudomonadota bacterium]|jgi:protein-S-isoprenylcysteine O-methyltransferase Ste14
MSDFLPNAIWYFVAMRIAAFFIFVPGVGKDFKRLKRHFQGSEVALRRALYLKGFVPLLVIGLAFIGLTAANEFSNSIWSWVVGFSCLFLAAGGLALFYAGPLRPLFVELEEAEARAHAIPNLHISHEGSK